MIAQAPARASILDLFRTPTMRFKTLIIYLQWFANAFAYFGLSMNTGDLGGIPEDQLVRERIWPPDGVQPTTADVVASLNHDGDIVLTSATPGASIGWRPLGQKDWRLYKKPVASDKGVMLETVAHRIGHKRSQTIRFQASEETGTIQGKPPTK